MKSEAIFRNIPQTCSSVNKLQLVFQEVGSKHCTIHKLNTGVCSRLKARCEQTKIILRYAAPKLTRQVDLYFGSNEAICHQTRQRNYSSRASCPDHQEGCSLQCRYYSLRYPETKSSFS